MSTILVPDRGYWGMGRSPMVAKRYAEEGYPTGLHRSSNLNQLQTAPAGWLRAGAFLRARTAEELQKPFRALKNGPLGLGGLHCVWGADRSPALVTFTWWHISQNAAALFFIARNEGSSMIPDDYPCIHRIKYSKGKTKPSVTLETRAMLSYRFKTMYRQLGFDRPAAAKLLRVSERTLQNWEAGVHEIPYSAYKLMRLLSYSELLAPWQDWHISAGRLWSPEGYGFRPEESSWWSALCRRSELFHVLYRRHKPSQTSKHFSDTPAAAGVPWLARSAGVSGVEVRFPVTPHLSLKIETDIDKTQQPRGFAQSCHNINFRFLKIKSTDLTKQGGK